MAWLFSDLGLSTADLRYTRRRLGILSDAKAKACIHAPLYPDNHPDHSDVADAVLCQSLDYLNFECHGDPVETLA
jgi:hypothetical protein